RHYRYEEEFTTTLDEESRRAKFKDEKMSMPDILTIGAKNAEHENSWKGGRLADLSIWNCWLERKEICALYQQKCSIDQMKIGTYLYQSSNKYSSSTVQEVENQE
ncbi:unnamed protein product, partial [Didymodactylos carnosus]